MSNHQKENKIIYYE